MINGNIPSNFNVMAKPVGAKCNLGCEYCFFLEKENLYPGSSFRMSPKVHEAYIKQLLEASNAGNVTISWQGGEPTLMGLDFYRESMELQKKYKKPGQQIENTFQTNGVLLDDLWCRFFRDNNFLIGLSIDGPADLHDHYRKDKAGKPTFDRVMKAVRLLQEYDVQFNILCTINSRNAKHPLKVYRFFRDKIKARYIQFIPVVEVEKESINKFEQGKELVSKRSVGPLQFGNFQSEIFGEWVRRDVGEMFVLNFDSILAGWLGFSGACIFSKVCGFGLIIEHNGDIYSCDHFVNSAHLIGNIMDKHLAHLVHSPKQHKFGQDKRNSLPQRCSDCKYLFLCNGECPRNRFVTMDEGKNENYLCPGYKKFFSYSEKSMRIMADLIRMGHPASEVMYGNASEGL